MSKSKKTLGIWALKWIFMKGIAGEGENWRIYKVVLDVDEAGQGLLKTARNMYNYILIGLAILLLGLITIALTPRRGTHIKVRSGTKSIRQRAAFLIDIFSFP